MGALCSAIPGAPTIEAPAPEEIAAAVKDALEGVPDAVLENMRTFRDELRHCNDEEPFEVPDTNLTLAKDATDNEIDIAAICSALGSAARDAIKDIVWGVLSPPLEEQIPAGTPQNFSDMALDKIKEKTVDVAVDQACDELLEKLKSDPPSSE